MSDHGVPAGWYADPDGAGERWWDGAAWTSSTRPFATPPSVPPPQPATPADAPQPTSVPRTEPPTTEPGGNRRARLAGALVAVVALVGLGVLLGLQFAGGDDSAPVAGSNEQQPATGATTGEDASAHTEPGTQDADASAPLAAEGPLEVVRSAEIVRDAPEGTLLSMSPGGRFLLVAASNDHTTVCLRAIDEPDPMVCSDALTAPHGRFVHWSADDQHAVIGDDVWTLGTGGDILLFDTQRATAELVGDTRPRDRDDPDAAFRIMLRPAVSPDGGRIAAFYSDDNIELPGVHIAVHDWGTGDTRVLEPVVGDATRILWEPQGDALWVTSLRGPGGAPAELTRIDLSDGSRRSVDNAVVLGELQTRGGPPTGELVQLDDAATVGLLLLSEVLGTRGQEQGLPYLALVDLETGATAPLLPFEPQDPELSGYTQMWGARLSSDGSEVLLTYHRGRVTYADPDPAVELRLARVPVDSILAGSPEVEVVVPHVADLTDIEVPFVVPGSPTHITAPVPGQDRRILLPLNRIAERQPVNPYSGPERFLELELAP